MHNPFDSGYYSEHDLRNTGFKKIGRNIRIAKNCTIVGIENISIGDNVRIDDYCSLLAVGGYIYIGSYIHIGSYSYLNGGKGITIEDFANISQGVRIYSKSDNFDGSTLTNPTISESLTRPHKSAVHIGRHCILGSGSSVLPGVRLNEGSAIGAMSLAKLNLSAWYIYAGIPAKKIKPRSKELLANENEVTQSNKI